MPQKWVSSQRRYLLEPALEAGASVVTFSWGDPTPYLRQVRAFDARLGIQVTNVAGARRALDLGADFLICQGMEAGGQVASRQFKNGHVQSTTPLWEVLPRVAEVAGDIRQP